MIILIALAALVFLLSCRALVRIVASGAVGLSGDVPPKLAGSRVWSRLQTYRSRFAARHPRLAAFVTRRMNPHRATGLPLTLTILAALYIFGLFSGLTEDVLEAQGTIHSDNVINIALQSWRAEPFVSAFLWITNLGSTQAVVAAVIIATGFLWPQRGSYIVISLWLTCLGAVATTTIGKLLIARHRPDVMLDPNAAGWSFPSGHATAAMAVYGFIAYAICRSLSGFRERFEVAYWAATLIVLIGFSRIFLGVHYLTDVLGGFMVGGFWLLIGFGIAETNKPPAPEPLSIQVPPPEHDDAGNP